MDCHCDTNNRVARWTFMDPSEPEVRPGAQEESVSPAWLAAPAMNAPDTSNKYFFKKAGHWKYIYADKITIH